MVLLNVYNMYIRERAPYYVRNYILIALVYAHTSSVSAVEVKHALESLVDLIINA